MKKLSPRTIAIADRASSVTLAFIGAVHITVLAVTMMLIFANSAKSQESKPPVCGGENLLVEIAKSDPGLVTKINEEAAKVPFGDTLLFKVEKVGVAPSYLFGTMHLTDPRVVTMPPAADAAFEGADLVAIESIEVLDPQKAQVSLMSKPELTMFVGNERLTNYLDAEDKDILKKGLAERGMNLALVDRMKPWLLTGMLALPECEMARKQAGESYLDLSIAERAQASGKQLIGLETFLEQFTAIASLPMEFHVQGLVDTLSMGDKINDVTETMIILYTEGKTGIVWPMLRAVSAQFGGGSAEDEEGYAAFEEAMVTTRNKTMLDRSLPLLEKGNAFVAVGALHLPGKDGLAKLYQDAGYTVTPVK